MPKMHRELQEIEHQLTQVCARLDGVAGGLRRALERGVPGDAAVQSRHEAEASFLSVLEDAVETQVKVVRDQAQRISVLRSRKTLRRVPVMALGALAASVVRGMWR